MCVWERGWHRVVRQFHLLCRLVVTIAADAAQSCYLSWWNEATAIANSRRSTADPILGLPKHLVNESNSGSAMLHQTYARFVNLLRNNDNNNNNNIDDESGRNSNEINFRGAESEW